MEDLPHDEREGVDVGVAERLESRFLPDAAVEHLGAHVALRADPVVKKNVKLTFQLQIDRD